MGIWATLRFTVTRHEETFLDDVVGETLSALVVDGRVETGAPVRVMLVDTKGAVWGSRLPLFMVHGTVGEFAPGETLKQAEARWETHLRRFGMEPQFDNDLNHALIEVPHRP